jgi:antitoxin HicB
MRYAIKLTRDGGTYVASCRDLPAFNSAGDSEAEALQESVDAITLVLRSWIKSRMRLLSLVTASICVSSH